MNCSIEDHKMSVEFNKEFDGDEIKAYREWLINRDYPQWFKDKYNAKNLEPLDEEETSYDPILTTKRRALEIIADTSNSHTNAIITKANSSKGTESLKGLAKLMEEANKVIQENLVINQDLSIVRFVEMATLMTDTAYKKVTELDIDIYNASTKELNDALKLISYFKDNAGAFDILKEIKEEFLEDPKYIDLYKQITELKNGMTTVDKIDKITTKYIEIAKTLIAKNMSRNYHKFEKIWEGKAQTEWNKNYVDDQKKQGIKGSELEKNKKAFIAQYLINHSVEIGVQTKEHLMKLLDETVDIDTISTYMVNPKDLNHDIIGHLTEVIDNADETKRKRVLEKVYTAESLYENFIKQVGKKGNPKDQFSVLYEKNKEGKPTNIMLNSESGPQWQEFKNRYKNTAVEELHTFLVDLVEEKSTFIPKYKNFKNKFELPRINKSTMERMYDNGIIHTLKERVKDFTQVRNKDTDLGEVETEGKKNKNPNVIEVSTNKSGKEKGEVPLFYRRAIEDNDLSYDLLSSMILDYENCLNWEVKMDLAVYLEAAKAVSQEASTIKTQGFLNKIKINSKSLSKRPVTEKGLANVVTVIDSLIRHRLYGIDIEGSPRMVKAVKGIRAFTSLTSMAFNIKGGIVNYLQGNIVMSIETSGFRTGKYTRKDVLSAAKKYHNPRELAMIVADIGNRMPKARTNLLRDLFNPQGKQNKALKHNFIQNNLLKRELNAGVMMFSQEIGEHELESVTMYSFLNNIKVLDFNGKFLDKDYNPTTDRTKAISLDEAISFDENGKHTFNDKVAKTEVTEGIEVEDLNKITADLRRVNRDLYGNYDSTNKAVGERFVLGHLVSQMRGWLAPGIQKRWRGVGTAGTKFNDIDPARISYNLASDRLEEGTYTSALRFLMIMGKETKQLKLLTAGKNAWSELTDYQKDNATKATVEFAIAALVITLSLALQGGEDDDDDKLKLEAAYISRRLYSELTSFIDPREFARTVRSPMLTLNMLEKSIDFILQVLSDPTEEYERGIREGQNKAFKKLSDLMPILNQLNNDTGEQLRNINR